MAKVKKTVLLSLLISAGFIITGCDKQSDTNDTNDTKKPSIVWVKPTEAVCKANGGEIFINKCQAKWEDAPKICKAFGARLPTFDELKSAMTECGGILNDTDRNENNQTYQKCREKLGFGDWWYWSSTERDSLNGASLNLETGNDVSWGKSFKIDVICIDINSSKN